jgi:hypothetical protein
VSTPVIPPAVPETKSTKENWFDMKGLIGLKFLFIWLDVLVKFEPNKNF